MARKSRPLADRLAAKLRREGDCLVYTGATQNSGYGTTFAPELGKRSMLAHRAAWMLARGPIPEGMQVCHTCDNRLGDAFDNMRDCRRKGRDVNSRKTHCPQGHPYAGDNLHLECGRTGTKRRCRSCSREKTRRYKARLKERAA